MSRARRWCRRMGSRRPPAPRGGPGPGQTVGVENGVGGAGGAGGGGWGGTRGGTAGAGGVRVRNRGGFNRGGVVTLRLLRESRFGLGEKKFPPFTGDRSA